VSTGPLPDGLIAEPTPTVGLDYPTLRGRYEAALAAGVATVSAEQRARVEEIGNPLAEIDALAAGAFIRAFEDVAEAAHAVGPVRGEGWEAWESGPVWRIADSVPHVIRALRMPGGGPGTLPGFSLVEELLARIILCAMRVGRSRELRVADAVVALATHDRHTV
jgi:hypothetical protein